MQTRSTQQTHVVRDVVIEIAIAGIVFAASIHGFFMIGQIPLTFA